MPQVRSKAVGGEIGLILNLRFVDRTQRLDRRSLVGLALHVGEVRNRDEHEDEHDRDHDQQLHQRETGFALAAAFRGERFGKYSRGCDS